MKDKHPSRKDVIKFIKKRLDSKDVKHCIQTEKVALGIGMNHKVDLENLSYAALLHDIARNLNNEELIKEAKRYNVSVTVYEKINPYLLHAQIGALIIAKEFPGLNINIINSVRLHTLGSVKMKIMDKIIYIADKLEPGKSRDKELINKFAEIENIAAEDIDKAFNNLYIQLLVGLIKIKQPIHPGSLKVYNNICRV